MAWQEIERVTSRYRITMVTFRCGSCRRLGTVVSSNENTLEQPSRCVCGSAMNAARPVAHRPRLRK